MFDGFPLTGLINIAPVPTTEDTGIPYGLGLGPEMEWVATLRRSVQFGTKVISGIVEEVRIPPLVVFEMQGHDRNAPVFTIHVDESDPWLRVEREINRAAEAVAAQIV